MPGFRSILCAVDFSPASRRALEEAADLSRRTGARLSLAHVEPGAPARGEAPFAPPPRGVREELGAAATLEAWVRDAEALAGGPVGKVLLAGKPADEILQAADDGAFDLVVVGTHGRTGLAHVVLGSIVERLVRQSRVPVLVVRGS
jgi:universal stress protein A